jgi:hypothetical protein
VVSPHFPPDTGAASHRYRLLAPRLAEFGWTPTVVTVEPRHLGARTEPWLERLVHGPVRVERVRAWGSARGRLLGVGDLGLRAMAPLAQRCRALLNRERHDLVLITMPPHYTSLLGPWLKRRTGTSFVLDYQDPWVGAWGLTVGGGPVDWKSRLSRSVGLLLEPGIVRQASGLVAVSMATLPDTVSSRSGRTHLPRAEIPLGGEPQDFEVARTMGWRTRYFDPADGAFHIVSVGTFLPHAREVLRSLLRAVRRVRKTPEAKRHPLRLHLIGTSNQTKGRPEPRASQLAREEGVADQVREHPLRIDYLDALTVLTQASAVLLVGSTEGHYTASRIYPAVLSGRPILAVYHESSTACGALRRLAADRLHLETFGQREGPEGAVERLVGRLEVLSSWARAGNAPEPQADLGEWSARALARKLAAFLTTAAAEECVAGGARGQSRAVQPA